MYGAVFLNCLIHVLRVKWMTVDHKYLVHSISALTLLVCCQKYSVC